MSVEQHKTRTLLPEPTLRRLPWYLAYVQLLHSQGVEFVSSTQIAKEIKVDASQIAKDLSFLIISFFSSTLASAKCVIDFLVLI